MKKGITITIIILVSVLLVGEAAFVICLWRANWDFEELSNVDYIEESVSFSADEVESITAEVGTKNIYYLTADDDKITVTYFTIKNKKGEVITEVVPTLTDGALLCKEEEKLPSVMLFDFHKDERLVIKVPAEKVLDVSLTVSTGNVTFGEEGKEQRAGSLKVKASTGNITLIGKTTLSKELSLEASTGNLKIEGDLDCAGDVSAKASTGKISVSGRIKGDNINFETSTGKVKVTSPMAFNALNVTTSTGDVSVVAAGSKEQYSYLHESSTGDSNIPSYIAGDKRITIHTSTGDIELSFAE